MAINKNNSKFMIYNVITFKDGSKQKCDDKYTEAQIREACKLKGLEVESVQRLGLVNSEKEEEKKLYYKVIWGFEDERVTSIEEKDLIKALYAMSLKNKVYLGDVLLDGKYIIAIKEDFHKTMGWNPTYELTSDDWNTIREEGVDRLFIGKLYEAKEKVQYIITSKDTNLLKDNTKQLN